MGSTGEVTSSLAILFVGIYKIVVDANSNPPLQIAVIRLRARSLVVSDLRSETEGSWLESSCKICAEVISLQKSSS